MFTPQRKHWSASDRKGKAVAFADEITTPSLQNGLGLALGSGEYTDDWRKFKEVGLLDEESLERKDREALVEKILKLEKELFDYQHNMGLLLIEKKNWTLRNEKLQQASDEAYEILKRERTSNLIALSEAEKREENLRKGLISEKQFAVQLEKDLKYLQQKHSEFKSTSAAKLAEANALVKNIEEKALEVDKKSAIAEEKLSLVNRKSSELYIKLKEVETREKVFQREHLSLVTEREAHEAMFYKQREDLQEWEKKLTSEEDKLSEARRSINLREEKATESERMIKKKERNLEELHQKVATAKSELKEREESINVMLNDISLKEKDFEAMKAKVDKKEKYLHELEEKLIAREQMEIGKLLDDQKAVLESRVQEFEKELEQKRISLDEELEIKKGEVEQQETEITHKGGKMGKREAALEKKEERVKEKDNDLEAKMKALKEKEKSLKAEEKRLQMENTQLLEDKECLCKLKVEIEEIRAETTKQESRIREEHESLRITKEERLEFLRLQSELKEQIEKCKKGEELLLNERNELKQEKERFEKEWEILDEKKVDITRRQKEITEEKEKLRSFKISEDHRLKKEEEGEEEFKERARKFEIRRQEELDNIDYAKQLAQKETEEVQSEKLALYREREELSSQKKLLKEQQGELQNDINELDVLSNTLKEQKQELICARERFLVFVENLKSCNSCGEITKEFVLSDLPLLDVEDGNKLSCKQIVKAQEAENIKRTSFLGRIASKTDQVTDLGPESVKPNDSRDVDTNNNHELSVTEQSFTDSRIQEAPEDSLQSDLKSDRPRRGRYRNKSVRGRTQAASRDSKPSDGEFPQKRQREQTSKITESEHAAGDSDEGVGSVTVGVRRKRRQISNPVSQTPGQSRYHLRRHRNVGAEEDKAQESTGPALLEAMEKKDSANSDIKTVRIPKEKSTQQGDTKLVMEVVTHERTVRAEEEIVFKDSNTEERPVEDGEREHGEDVEKFSMIDEEIEEGEDEEETERVGDASIGKKIWVFFTT